MVNFSFKIEKLFSRRNRVYKIIGLVLIVLGVLGATFPFWGANFLSDDSILEKFGQSETEIQASATSSSPDTVLAQIKNRLFVAGADINMPLFLSNNDKVLSKGGWMYSGNSTPDKGGNTVIFGHRWLYKPPIQNTFYNLDKVAIGDRFSISWNGTIYNYQVSEVKIVNPTDVYVLNPTDTPQITLITCTPLFSTKQRLVVIGKLI